MKCPSSHTMAAAAICRSTQERSWSLGTPEQIIWTAASTLSGQLVGCLGALQVNARTELDSKSTQALPQSDAMRALPIQGQVSRVKNIETS